MNDIVPTLWAMVLIVASIVTLLGFVPYGIWMIYTAFKKRWKQLTHQIVIPLGVFFLLMGVSWILFGGAHERVLEAAFDAKVRLDKPIFEFDSGVSFNGDGYTLSVYELPSAIRARFEDADEKLLSEFPKSVSSLSLDRCEPWRRSPFDEKFDEYLEFSLSDGDAENTLELKKQCDAIRRVLKQEGAFYAFFYNDRGMGVSDVEFFVVDLIGDRLYLISVYT